MTNEEILVQQILFEEKLKKEYFKNINYSKFVKIASSHLMLPSIYLNLKNKKKLSEIPKNLENYLEQIYKMNKARNLELVEEVKEISNILNSNKINHVFLKGTAGLFADIYYSRGERMISDIDILIEKKQYEEIKNLMQKFGYKPKNKHDFFSRRHFSPMINQKKKFSIEFHHRLFNKSKELLKEKLVFNNKLKLNGINMPSFIHQVEYTIYSFQINDEGSLRLLYNYRTIYDYFLITKNQINLKFEMNRHTSNFLYSLKKLKLNKLISTKIEIGLSRRFRFYLIWNFKIYRKLEKNLIDESKKLDWRFRKLKELIINKKYRDSLM